MKIAIASGKGGTGKTTLSVNLFAMLAREHKVVLSDLDVEEPNAGLFLQKEELKRNVVYKHVPEWEESSCTLCGDCQNNCNFNAVIQIGPGIVVFPELCHSCYACSELCPTQSLPMIPHRIGMISHYRSGNRDFVEGRLDIGQEQAVPLIASTLRYVDEHFGEDTIKLYDAPPGTSCPVIESTREADRVILVTEPTPFGFHDLKLAAETMQELGKAFGIVINRQGIGSDVEIREYCRQHKIPLIAEIPDKKIIAERYSRGELLFDKLEAVREPFSRIIDYIMDKEKP
ncbi:MAG: ATP-binding protein [Bacteroidota bacterium]|nr:ATP-binding protein [Bacteroidota bacterium]